MSLSGKKIILGVTGGIAAYKSVYLLRLLKKAGAEVRVVMTPSTSHFVGELTFSSLADEAVFSDLWGKSWSAHVEWGLWADFLLVAPCTANTLAKMAHGLCDNALTAVYLSAKCPVMVAPAMDLDMYQHARTQANLETLRSDGVHVLPSAEGFLASGLQGPGRMLEPEEIVAHLEQVLSPQPQLLRGKKLLLTAGPTQEALDPVRYLTNHSTGKMGYALAEVAAAMGAQVTLVSGPTQLPSPPQVETIRVRATQQMYEAVMARADEQDILIMAAAVSDYTPVEVSDEKIKKKPGEGDEMLLRLKRTQDILASVGKQKRPDQTLIGFALETENEEANARGKLERKNLDGIVLNSLRTPGAGFAHDTNQVTFIPRNGEAKAFPLKSKMEVARDILGEVVGLGT